MTDEKKQPHATPSDGEPTQTAAAEATRCPNCADYLSGWKRAQADYQNLKRDVEREKTAYVKFANERLLQDLLPAIDQFALMLQHVPDVAALPEAERKIWDNWLVGVRAVQTLWEQAARSVGLERVPSQDAFDPALHEAAGEEASERKGSGAILRVVQDGWRLHGKVLRPARVIVAR